MKNSKATKDLIDFWEKLEINSNYFIHNEDSILSKDFIFDKPVQDYSDENDMYKFHSGLFPIPYIGDIKKATCYILMLNPGYSNNDYEEENKEYFKHCLINNLKQNDKNPYPFFYLDPKNCNHPGYAYWKNKFKTIIDELNCENAIEIIAKKVAIIQLVPYHSQKVKLTKKIISSLKSVKEIIKFIEDINTDDSKQFIVVRQAKNWGLNSKENVLIYNRFQARGGHLSINTEGGKKIKEILTK